jgi:hypothetical protein
MPKENKTLKMLQEEFYASKQNENNKIVNESPKIALTKEREYSNNSSIESQRRIESNGQLNDWDQMTNDV